MARQSWMWLGVALLLVPAAAALVSDDFRLMGAHLPSPRACTSAVWTGSEALIFGGYDRLDGPYFEDILQYDPWTDTLTVAPTHIPGGAACAAAVWLDGKAYLIGGGTAPGTHPLTGASDRILIYDPETGSLTTASARLAFPQWGLSAAAYDGRIYIFGGYDPSTATTLRIISVYDPVADVVTVLSTEMPTEFYQLTAVASDTDLYALQVSRGPGGAYQYSPTSGTISSATVSAFDQRATAGIWDDALIHLYGGSDWTASSQPNERILLYDPVTRSLELSGRVMPQPLAQASAVYIPADAACVFGGAGLSDLLDTIYCTRDLPAPPLPDANFDARSTATCWSRLGSFVALGEGIAFEWTFGDGGSGAGNEVSHEYAAPGEYEVSLTVTSIHGTRATVSRTVLVPGSVDCPPVLHLPPPLRFSTGSVLEICARADSGLGGELQMLASNLPPGATFEGSCLYWTPTRAESLSCIRITVTEEPRGLSDSGCMRIEIIDEILTDDADQDGVSDSQDNCPNVPNTLQLDQDADGEGDFCEPSYPHLPTGHASGTMDSDSDTDSDGIVGDADNCPSTPNPDQRDLDIDSLGDACDSDLDGDGIPQDVLDGAYADNCPTIPNPAQEPCTVQVPALRPARSAVEPSQKQASAFSYAPVFAVLWASGVWARSGRGRPRA